MAQPPNWGAINWIILKLYSWFGHFQDYRMLKTTATKSVWIRVHVVKISVWYQWIKVNVNMKSNLLKSEHYLFTPQLGTSWPSLAHFFLPFMCDFSAADNEICSRHVELHTFSLTFQESQHLSPRWGGIWHFSFQVKHSVNKIWKCKNVAVTTVALHYNHF